MESKIYPKSLSELIQAQQEPMSVDITSSGVGEISKKSVMGDAKFDSFNALAYG